MSARDAILGRIRQSLGRSGPPDDAVRAELDARLKSRPRGLIPERGRSEGAQRIEDFRARAEQVEATVEDIPDLAAVPAAVADYLSAHNLPAELKVAPHPDLTGLDWSHRPTLEASYGATTGSDGTSLTRAFCGIAETGTLVQLSGPEGPTTLNFLPETHLVVLAKSEIVGAYEDAWDRLRDRLGPDGMLSRVVNMITGPSRTGDIEQTIELGAHGPLRLHILLVDDL
jgi:L-lactate dehydrogenase complex protein LldG